MPKCAHWEFPTAEAPLSARWQCSSLCLLRPKTLLVISFSLSTASHRGKYSIEQPVEEEDVRVFWWFVQADLFVLSVLAVSLESILLEVNSLCATTSHPCTEVKNKCDIELGIDVELKHEMTALLGRTIIDLCFHGFMVKQGPFLLLWNYSRRHLWARISSALHKNLQNLIFQQCNARWMLASSNKTKCSCSISFRKWWWNSHGPPFLFLPWGLGSSGLTFMLKLFYPHYWEYFLLCHNQLPVPFKILHFHCI